MYELLLGDCIEIMKTLPANSVQCCVTSPPYFGLRDYGTATWEGGDAGCDHVANASKTKTFGNPEFNGTRPSREATKTEGYYFKDTCGKCGARRIDNQIGLEETPEAYIAKLVQVFREVRRLLRDDGVLFLNLGDSYYNYRPGVYDDNRAHAFGGERDNFRGMPSQSTKRGNRLDGLKEKDLIGIPWMAAFALRADGWWLRSEIIWHKKAPMPESVTDRPTRAHEQVFLLTKSASYYYDAEAIREPNSETSHPGTYRTQTKMDTSRNDVGILNAIGKSVLDHTGRNKRSVWTLGPESYSGAHFATMPTKLVEPCILAGSKVGDTVLDPFNGSGTTGAVSLKHGRNYIGIDLNANYIELAHTRITQSQPMLAGIL